MKTVIVTPSYAPDFERCKILCESVKKFVTSYDRHILIVDRKDLSLFKTITGPKIEIITKESILPRWIKKIPFSKKWWLSLKTLPIRGWILQQIIKLAVAEFIDADVYVFCDSDIIIVRPTDASVFIKNEKVRLFRFPRVEKDFTEPRHVSWYRTAQKMFNLTGDEYLQGDYIGHLITWRRDTLLKLNRYIEKRYGKKDWKTVMGNTLHFSEYILYGIFCEFILKEESGHYVDTTDICHSSWHYPVDNLDDLRTFLEKLRPEHHAICIQSNLKIEPHKYIDYIKSVIDK